MKKQLTRPNNNIIYLISQFIGFVLILYLLGYGVSVVQAHGGGEIQLANVPIDTYKMTVWLNPPQPQANQTLHITAGLSAPPDDAPVLDAVMEVQVVDAETQQQILSVPATTAQSTNKLFYETDFTIADEGQYDVILLVTTPTANGTASFPMAVSPARSTNWLVIGLVALGLVVVFSLYRNRTTA